MKTRYLEVTYRLGKPLAAYLYLPRQPGDKSVRTQRDEKTGLVSDFAADGRLIRSRNPCTPARQPNYFERDKSGIVVLTY